jgi:competence protein ComEC
VLGCTLAFAQAGARASHYAQSTFNPALEGSTLQAVGIVANLPQRMEDSARFRFEVESARDNDGALVQLPPQLLLGWYGNRLNGRDDKVQASPADLRPGDCWQFAVRLKDHSGGASAVMAMQSQADVLTSIAVEHPLQQLGSMQRC